MGLVVVLGGSHALGAPKELVRQREALASKRRAPEAPCVVLSLKAPDDTRRRRTGETVKDSET